MSDALKAVWRFVGAADAEVEKLPGKTHFFHCKPEMIPGTNLYFIRAHLAPGHAHHFHFHPHMEEILYILSGTSEQWVETNKRMLQPGDSVIIPPGVIHATFNPTNEVLDFLAVLTPANNPGPFSVELGDQEPWKSLRPLQ